MILLGTRDAGPAHYLAKIAEDNPQNFRFIGSRISKPVFKMYGLEEFSGVMSGMSGFEIIMTGTCLDSGLDKDLVIIGKANGVTTVSVVDHWTFIKERFTDEKNHAVIPYHVIVNDDYAMSLAISAGIPSEKVLALGNPVLEFPVFKNNDAIAKAPAGKVIDSIENGMLLLFISEQLAQDYRAHLYQDEGYDEYRVLEDICSILEPEDRVWIKLHPQEDAAKYNNFLSGQVLIADSSIPTGSLLETADWIIGMRSMLLLEASNMRCDILSYRPGTNSTFIGNKLGVTLAIEDKNMLKKVLRGKIKVKNSSIMALFKGSTTRIRAFLDHMASCEVSE